MPDAVVVTDRSDPVGAVFSARNEGRLLALPTSGSTGRPRRVIRTPWSWFATFPTVSRLMGLDVGSTVWIPGPLTGTMNLFAAVHARWAGAEVVGSPKSATHAVLTPTVLRAALRQELLSPRATLVVAGDRLEKSLYERARGTGRVVHHYYGSSELSFVAWGSHVADLRAFPGVEVKDIDGTLWVRSPFVANGYNCVVEGAPLDRNGEWSSVGDRGTVRGDRVAVHGRGTRAVTTGGATVHVAEVEATIRPHLSGEIVILGLPHRELGEVLCAVLTDPGDVEVARRVAQRELSRAARPCVWHTLPELPSTEQGKLDPVALRHAVTRLRASGRAS